MWSRPCEDHDEKEKKHTTGMEREKDLHQMLQGAAHGCLSVSQSVCLALKIPALKARRPQNLCPRHARAQTHTHPCAYTHAHTHTQTRALWPVLSYAIDLHPTLH